ncbi:MAG: sulfurtransferase-like selenium metabolism protein YedF [bacterium]
MTFLYLASDRMGSGDDELGRELMVSYLRELAASEVRIDVVGCANSGIRLTTEGSKVIEYLEALQERGARIATCGTCLDHFGRREALLIGEIGTMDRTVRILATADRIIRP